MTIEILKYPQTYAILGIIISLIYITYIQIISTVMYIKYLIFKKINSSTETETIDSNTGNIVKVSNQQKFNSMKYDLATSVGFNFLLISILALVYIEYNL